jgi:transcription elongation factor GreA
MENESNRYKMSPERLEELKKELEYDETVREKEVSELIKEARSFGDLSENSEYDEAKTEQGKLYSRIAELKDLIENAEVIERVEAKAGEVNLGCKVDLLDMEEDEETTYEIVGSQEANPMMGRISDDSPVGKALLGHAAGDAVTVEVQPGVHLKFKVLKVVTA